MEWRRGEPMADRRGAWRAGAVGGCTTGQGVRMGAGRIKADEADCERIIRTRQWCDAHVGMVN